MKCSVIKGYNIDVIKQSACLVVNPIMVDQFAYLFNCMLVGRGSEPEMAPSKNKTIHLLLSFFFFFFFFFF